MLELCQVSKRYGQVQALAPADLVTERGRTTVLIGSSGSGKSTLLRIMIGLIEPDSGEVRVDGQRLTRQNVVELRHRMGYVIQDGGLFPHLDALGNAALLARHLGWTRERIESRLQELLELTHLPADVLERYPTQLSGGQRQRVSLMRALMLDPDVLLLDEPLAALDPMIRTGLQQELREIFRALGKTVVLVTHDIGEAAFFGDAILLLREGAIVQRGPMRELLQNPAEPFVTRFINAQRTVLEDA